MIYLPEASSLSTRHPEPLDVRGLSAADVLLLSRLSSADVNTTPEAAIDRAMQVHNTNNCLYLSNNIVKLITGVLKEGGNVLVPTYPSGIVREFFSVALRRVNRYLISLSR